MSRLSYAKSLEKRLDRYEQYRVQRNALGGQDTAYVGDNNAFWGNKKMEVVGELRELASEGDGEAHRVLKRRGLLLPESG